MRRDDNRDADWMAELGCRQMEICHWETPIGMQAVLDGDSTMAGTSSFFFGVNAGLFVFVRCFGPLPSFLYQKVFSSIIFNFDRKKFNF